MQVHQSKMTSSSQVCRSVYNQWPRKKEGPLLAHNNAPVGIRTPNQQPWGHDCEDFYWIQRLPGVNCLTVWSISMIREFGEEDGDIENRFEDDMDDAYKARVRKPWPLLKLPDGIHCEQVIGIQDEGSLYCLNYTNPNYQTEDAENPSQSLEHDTNQTQGESSCYGSAIIREAENSHSAQMDNAISAHQVHGGIPIQQEAYLTDSFDRTY